MKKNKDYPEYSIWKNMRSRCKNDINYVNKNISVCKRWNSFKNFYEDMGSRPSKKHSIDRIDNNGNYEPSNCRWATQDVQCKNRGSFNNIFKYNGKTMVLKDWAKELNIKYTTLYQRIYRANMSFEDAISTKNRYKSFELNGEFKSLKEWAFIYNIPYKNVNDRVSGKKWDLLKALTTPIKR